ncbi:hypothetical protein EJB05_14827, partial [Eragrostis curvula]
MTTSTISPGSSSRSLPLPPPPPAAAAAVLLNTHHQIWRGKKAPANRVDSTRNAVIDSVVYFTLEEPLKGQNVAPDYVASFDLETGVEANPPRTNKQPSLWLMAVPGAA